eukprot:symbB.v1.2.022166.t1/scaffold1954.1/size95041/9
MADPMADLLLQAAAMQQLQMQQLMAAGLMGPLPGGLAAVTQNVLGGLSTASSGATGPGGAELAPISSASSPPIRSGKGGGKVMRKIAMCKFFMAGTCQKGIHCNFAHSQEQIGEEVLLPPIAEGGVKMKTMMCKFFMLGTCNKGEMCAFAHSETQIGTPVADKLGDATSEPSANLPARMDSALKGAGRHRSSPYGKGGGRALEDDGLDANGLASLKGLSKKGGKGTMGTSPTDLMRAVQAMHEMQNLAVMQSPSL